MTGAVERRYRRVLRLLPGTYRDAWEEDMMSAFMEGATGRSLAERLSVVSLAVRLRLNGSHASSRGLVWYHIAHALALLVLLYQAVSATVAVAFGVGLVTHGEGSNLGWLYPFETLAGLPWIAAFSCFVAGRFVAARVFALLAAATAIAFMIYIVAVNGLSPEPIGLSDLSRWAWLAMSVLATFVSPSRARASRSLWTVAYVVGSAVASALAWRAFTPMVEWVWHWTRLGNVVDVASAGLVIAMVVALVRVWRTRSPHWVLALAAIGGGIAAIRLLRTFVVTPPAPSQPSEVATYLWQVYILNLTMIVLAVICAALGLLRWYRIPARTQS